MNSSINIFGLSIGICASIIIMFIIQFEFSYDNFHNDTDRLYRISINRLNEGKIETTTPVFTPPIGPDMKNEFPEIENYTRITIPKQLFFKYENDAFKVNNIVYADSTFFDLFSFAPDAVNKNTLLVDPFSIILTKSTAKRIFGDKNPVGEILLGNDQKLYTVKSVIEDPPDNSHLAFNALIAFSTLYTDSSLYMDWFGGNQYVTYIKTSANTSIVSIEEKMPDFLWEKINERISTVGAKVTTSFQPIEDLHLYYDSNGNNLRNIIVLSVIALIILAMACINFINITTSYANTRMKEVGIRKVFGADRQILFRQFMTESMVVIAISLLAAILILELASSYFNDLVSFKVGLMDMFEVGHIIGIIILVSIIALIAGSYPSLYIASFKTVTVLKGVFQSEKGRNKMRNGLVLFQIATSIVLIICTLFINQQIKYMNNKELGFDRENIIYIPLIDKDVKINSISFRDELRDHPNVITATASTNIPLNGLTRNGYIPEGYQTSMMFNALGVDEYYFETFGIELLSGRSFYEGVENEANSIIINEALANSLGWTNPIGRTITRNNERTIVGMVKDFHFATLHNRITPLIIYAVSMDVGYNMVSVKVKDDNMTSTIADINNIWNKYSTMVPMEYYFLDDSFNNLYNAEKKFELLLLTFSIIALMIALLGSYGLISFSVARKTREIGIRKVLGASTVMILKLISREFMIVTVIANLIAWPVAYYVLKNWQENFAYRIGFSLGVYLLGSFMVLALVFVTIGIRSMRAALSNPMDTIKYE